MKVLALKSPNLGNGMDYYRSLYSLYVAFFLTEFFFFTEAVTEFLHRSQIPQKKLILCDYVSPSWGPSETTKCFQGTLFYLILSRAAPGFTDMTLRGHSSVFVGLNVTLCFSPVTHQLSSGRRGCCC